jgi:hypothetical protein
MGMSEEAPPSRSGRSGAIFVAVLVAGSAVGVIGWYLMTNRTGPTIDASGFDLSTAPQAPRPRPVYTASAPSTQPDSLSMMKGDAGVRIGDANMNGGGSSKPAPKEGDKKEQSHLNFTEQARKHEGDVRRFAERMTRKYPVIRQYGKDWMSHPDLRALTDNYWKTRDPVAFIMGLAKAPSLGPMVKQYAGSPEIMKFVTEGMKEAPSDLMSSAMDVLSNDRVVKDLVSNVASGIGLPSSVTAVIGGTGDPSKIDQTQVVNDMMKNNPEMQKALQQQGQQTTPVVLPNQR